MDVVLDYWNRRWQSVAFNVDDGKGRVRWFSRNPKECSGFVMRHDGRWYAIWSSGEQLMFQSGSTLIAMSAEYKCRNSLIGSRRFFSVEKDGLPIVEVSYKSYDGGLAGLLTYSNLDELDFFYWVWCVWNDKDLLAALRRGWKKQSSLGKGDGFI